MHLVLEIATICGIVSAVVVAWMTVIIRVGRKHIDQRCAETIKEEVSEIIDNGVTARIDRLDAKLERLIDLHLWDGTDRRHS
jgi:hypothetical protein